MENAEFVFVTDLAGAEPTRQEIEEGKELIHAYVIAGFETTPTSIDVSDGSSKAPRSIHGMLARPGPPTVRLSGNPFLSGDDGMILQFPEGDVPGRPLIGWPVIVGDVGRSQRDPDGVERRDVTFGVPGEPHHWVVPPATP